MKSLGLDISTVSTGWAVLETLEGSPNPKLLKYGCIEFSYAQSFKKRLVIFRELIKGVLEQYPDLTHAVVEDTFVNKNPKTTKQLNRFAGVGIEAVASYLDNIQIVCVIPASIRSAIFPGMKVDKDYIEMMMKQRYSLPAAVKNDVTDAIAAALFPFYRTVEDKWIL